MTLRLWLAAVLLAALAGCSTAPPEPPASYLALQRQLQALDHFTASGKIALRTPEQAESASLLWQQAGAATHLTLSGPLGIAATTLDSDGEFLELRRGDDFRRWRLDEAEPGDTPGWDLPVRALPFWLRGISAPGLKLEAISFDAAGTLPSQLQQQGWRVQYQRWGQFGALTLPTRIEVSREDTWARIVLSDWRDLAATAP